MPYHSKRRTSSNEQGNAQNYMRKVRSMDSVNALKEGGKHPQEYGTYNTTEPCSPRSSSRKVASKFSSDGRAYRAIFSHIDENEVIFSSQIENHRFIQSSSSSRLLPTAEDTPDELGSTIFSRGIIVGYLSVICLFIVTFKLHHDKNSSPRYHGTSQKLGAAAIGSLTTAFSPILPFTGGADLRRGEYSLTELLPTGTFDSWDSMNMFGREYVSKEPGSTQGRKASFTVSLENMIRVPRGGAQNNLKRERLASKKQIEARKHVISASESFLHLDEIAKMTLTDLATVMEYTVNANREGFSETNFYKELSTRMRNSIRVFDLACSRSRGKEVLPAKTISDSYAQNKFGNIDALQFSAAMRVFAEWRMLRQVPEGYKGYAVGMGLGHKDVLQNLGKVETAIFAWIEERREMIKAKEIRMQKVKEECNSALDAVNSTMPNNCYVDEDSEPLVLRSPTLYELLKDEVDFDVHNGKLPRLKEKSAAMGLLWVRRQLQYQTATFQKVKSGDFEDVPGAVSAAYKEVYNKYHGWAVQKIFNYSFQSAPLAEEIYKVMNPEYLEEILEKARNEPVVGEETSVQTMKTVDNTQDTSISDEIEVENEDEKKTMVPLENTGVVGFPVKRNPFEKFGHFIAAEWDKFGQHIQGEIDKLIEQWEKIAANTLGIFGIKLDEKPRQGKMKKDGKPKPSSQNGKNVRGGSNGPQKHSINKGLQGTALEHFINEHITKYAFDQMDIYLKIAVPLLQDLDKLFEQLNMNDPTKV